MTINQQIFDEACDWFEQFRAGQPGAETRRNFEKWLTTSPEHVRAYLEQVAIAETLGAIPRSDLLEVDVLVSGAAKSGTGSVVELPLAGHEGSMAMAGEGDRVETDNPPGKIRATRRVSWAVAATVLLAVIGLSLSYFAPQSTYATKIGEQRSILLADGSTVDLNARSKIRVRLDTEVRNVELISGEALFSVAKDADRPFVVAANGTRVRALGTQFDVNHRSRGLVVTVVEGTVAVSGSVIPPVASRRDRSHSQVSSESTDTGQLQYESRTVSDSDLRSLAFDSNNEIVLAAGQQLTLTDQSGVIGKKAAMAGAQLRNVDVGAATAWMQRRLVFDSTPLEDVIADFNRNSSRALVIRGENLSNFHVSGAFSSTDVEPFLRFLESQPGVQVMKEPDKILILHQ